MASSPRRCVHFLHCLLSLCLGVVVDANEADSAQRLHALELNYPALRARLEINNGVGKEHAGDNAMWQKWDHCVWHVAAQVSRGVSDVEEQYLGIGMPEAFQIPSVVHKANPIRVHVD